METAARHLSSCAYSSRQHFADLASGRRWASIVLRSASPCLAEVLPSSKYKPARQEADKQDRRGGRNH
jgi:hypothetical protein